MRRRENLDIKEQGIFEKKVIMETASPWTLLFITIPVIERRSGTLTQS